ncbi:hypothetical protein MKR81_09365 [Vibrio campbellii]|uniref:hypothetical protein n=1 Tax=Vibrio campbellii TaxID=680 RepID=UPI001F084C61|nr:hypothetical protein [Vibrio campbellii]UMM01791.1 hypothetical protein MKR81_09365 [Vibrio campbellii]
MAINEMVTDSVESHIQSLTHDKFEVGKSKVAQLIESRGSHSVILPEYYEATDEHKLPKDKRKKGYFDYDVSVVRTVSSYTPTCYPNHGGGHTA